MQMLHLLASYGVDIARVDQDGAAPVHVAAAHGSLSVLKFLQEHSVDMRAPGSIFLFDGPAIEHRVYTAVTPLVIAQMSGRSSEIIAYLQSLEPTTVDTPTTSSNPKRARSSTCLADRAALVGVTNRLQPIPDSCAPDCRDKFRHVVCYRKG